MNEQGLLIIAGLGLCLFGIGMLISPSTVYYITESWKSNSDSEPSKSYKTMMRVRGGIVLVCGLFVFIGSFFI